MGENATLVKFGQHDHIKQLRDEGLLYMNNLFYFWKIEKDELRGDLFDGIRIGPDEPKKVNIFCMYALRSASGSFPVHEKNYKFGDHALILTNPQEFINRLSVKLNTESFRPEANLVEYYDDTYIGKVGPFRKPDRLAYQSEWRLVCYDGPGKAREIRIGSIEDISITMPSIEVNQRIKIGTNGKIYWE